MQVCLDTTLPRLAVVVLLLSLRLLRVIAREAGYRSTNGASNTVMNSLAEVRELSLSFLALALLVLANALLLEALGAYESTDGFLGRAYSLVPGARAAVGVVFGEATGGSSSEGAGFGSRVREVVFSVGRDLLVLGLLLSWR